MGTAAKEHVAQSLHTEVGFLQGNHQPKIQADDLLHPPRHSRWQIALMHLSHEPLALFATQRYGCRWLLHPSSCKTRPLTWLSDAVDVTVAWQLVKPRERTRPVADDGLRRALSGAATSI